MMWPLWIALGYLIAGCLMAAMAKWDVEDGTPFAMIAISVCCSAVVTPWIVFHGVTPWTITNIIRRGQ